jgi:hypothetical protein
MAIVKILPRLGKDFTNYLKRSGIDQRNADLWAIENYVLINGKKLSVEDILKISDKSYLMIAAKIFPMQGLIVETDEDDNIITDAGVTIRAKEIHRDFITKLQTETSKSKDNVSLMLSMVGYFYDVSITEIEELDYKYLAFMMEKMNFFLAELTTPRDEFDIDDLPYTDTEEITPASLDRVVS